MKIAHKPEYSQIRSANAICEKKQYEKTKKNIGRYDKMFQTFQLKCIAGLPTPTCRSPGNCVRYRGGSAVLIYLKHGICNLHFRARHCPSASHNREAIDSDGFYEASLSPQHRTQPDSQLPPFSIRKSSRSFTLSCIGQELSSPELFNQGSKSTEYRGTDGMIASRNSEHEQHRYRHTLTLTERHRERERERAREPILDQYPCFLPRRPPAIGVGT